MFRHEVRKAPRLRQVVAAGAVAGIFVALVTIPTSRTIEAGCVLSPSGTSELTAPHTGTIAEVKTNEGAWLAAGDLVAVYDTADVQRRRAALQSTLKTLALKQRELKAPAHRSLVTAVDQAEAARSAASRALERANRPNKRAAQNKLAKAEAALARARTRAGPSWAEVDLALTQARSELDQLEAQSPHWLSSTQGVVRALHLAVGDSVEAGAGLISLDTLDPLKVTVSTDEQSLEPGTTAELHFEQGGQQVTLQSGGVAVIANAAHALRPGMACTARLAGAAHPLLHW